MNGCGCSSPSPYSCTKVEYSGWVNIYNINWDAKSTDCTCYGKQWFTSVSGGTGGNCCGDDTTADDFYYHSANPTIAISLACTRCLDGTKYGPTTLYGNGYWTGTTCYYGNIVCTASSASHGTSGSTYCSSGISQCCPTQANRAEGVSCSDGSIGGTLYDRDTSSARCTDGSSTGCTAYTWTGTACCGNDGSESYCEGDKQTACVSGTAYNTDSNSGACSQCGGTWMGASCCGDDGGEVYRTRVCTSGCTSDSGDNACCDASTDCVLSGTCYNSGSYACNGDTVLYCNSGSWQSASNRGDTDTDGNREGCKSGQWVETKITSASSSYNYDGHPSHYKYWPEYVNYVIYYVNYQTEAQVAQVTTPTVSGEGDYKVTYCVDDDLFTGCTPTTIGNRGTCTDGVVKDYGALEPASGTTYYDDQYRDCDTGNPSNILSRDPYDSGNNMRIYYEDMAWPYGKYQICANYTDVNDLNSDPYCVIVIDEYEDVTVSSLNTNYQKGTTGVSWSGTVTDRYDTSPPQDNFLELRCRTYDADWYHSVTSDNGLSFSARGIYQWDDYWAYFYLYYGTSSSSGQSGTVTSTITFPSSCYLRDRDSSDDYSFYHHNCNWYHEVDGADKTVWCCPGGSWSTSSCTNGDSFTVSGQYGGTLTIANAITYSGGTTPNDNSDDIRVYVECPSGTGLGNPSDPYSISLSGHDYFWMGDVDYGGSSFSAPFPDGAYTSNYDFTGASNNEYSCSIDLITCGKQKLGTEAYDSYETHGGTWTSVTMVDEITVSNPGLSGSTNTLTPSVDLIYCSHDSRSAQITCELNDATPDTSGYYCQGSDTLANTATSVNCNINGASCSGGSNTVYCRADDPTYTNIEGTSISQFSFNPDDGSGYCQGCGHSWLSGTCCGDDSGEDFENPGSGNSCCINAEAVPNNATDTSGKLLCLDGEIYGCISGCGASGETIDGACTRRDGRYCDDITSDTWVTQISAGGTPDDCDGSGTEYPYGADEAGTTYDKETCLGNAMWNDRGNGVSNQNMGYQCRDNTWNGPFIADCTLSQSGSGDEFMTITAYWETSDETPDTYSNTGHHRWRIDNDGAGTGACVYGTNGCYYDTGLHNGCDNVDANEGSNGDYHSETIQWSAFVTKPSAETTYYLEIGEEECSSSQITADEDPNDNEGSCTDTATLCVPPGYLATTDSGCCPNGATTGTYPGKDDDGGNCVKCSAETQTLGGTGNGACEQKCGAAANCDETVAGECPNNQYICTSSCAYTDRDTSEAYCEDSSGCTAFVWTSASCCGNDGAETYVDAGDTNFLCNLGTAYSCNSPHTKTTDVDHNTGAKVGSYYCTASGWSMTPPPEDENIVSCEDGSDIWIGGSLEEGCCESGEEFIAEDVVEDRMEAYFKFDESPGTNKTDDEQIGLVGDLLADTTIVTSSSEVVSGNAMSFDGAGDYINVPHSGLLNVSQNMTISFWAKPGSMSNYIRWLSKSYYSTDKRGWTILRATTDSVYLAMWDSSSVERSSPQISYTQGEWAHFVFVYKHPYVYSYKNGVQVGSPTNVGSWTFANSAESLKFGKGYGSSYYTGNLDEVMIWTRSLNGDEVAVLYRQFPEYPQSDVLIYLPMDENSGGTTADYSQASKTGTLQDNTAWGPGKSGSGLGFDGSGDYVSFSSGSVVETEDQLTVAAWINITEMSGADYFVGEGAAFRVGVTGTDEVTCWIRGNNSGGSDTSDATTTTSSPVASTNKWYHVVCTWDGAGGGDRKIYVDGRLVVDGSSAVVELNGDSDNFAVGTGYAGSTEYFKGGVEEVRVYNRVLTEQEIKYLYGVENWRKYGCDSGALVSCEGGDDCTKNLDEGGIAYYCYNGTFKDYREVVDDCPGACTSQGGTWTGGGGDKNCCISSSEYWCNETAGVDKLCYGGIVYPCDYWCDAFGEVESVGYTCTSEADGDCTSNTTCGGNECNCFKSQGTPCSWDWECSENNCLDYSDQAPADPSLGSISADLDGSVCCQVGTCAFDQDTNGTVDSCAVNTSHSLDVDGDNDLDYCFDGGWRECSDYVAENSKANDCACLGNGIAIDKYSNGTWLCRVPPVSFTYDTEASCGTPCDSDSDTSNTEMLDSSGNCKVFDTSCSEILTEAWWEGNTSLIAAHVVTYCPCGGTTSCNISVESNGIRASDSFSAPTGQNVTAALAPNFAYGENNVTIACTCAVLSTTCWDKSEATVSSSITIPAIECAAGKACGLKANVTNIGDVDANVRAYLQASRNSQQRVNGSSYLMADGTYHEFDYTDTYSCSWQNATWLTGTAGVPVDYTGTVEMVDLAYNFSTNKTGNLVQCEASADCNTCCAGYWWCWTNSSNPADFACSAGVCCPTGKHFQKGACCLSSERCCIDDGDCNQGEWCDNYTTGFPDGNLFCREKKELGYTCLEDRECDSEYCGDGICADPEPVALTEWFECKSDVTDSYCMYQSIGKGGFDPKGCNLDGDCNASHYCYLPRRACIRCAEADTTYAGLNISDDGLCPSISCIGYDLDCCTSDSDCQAAEWCDAAASCTACSTRSDGVCSSSSCIGTDPDCCSTSNDCGEGLSCVSNTCTGNVGQACSGDGQCTGGLKCLGGVCAKETFMSLSPEEDTYDANLGDTLKLTLIVADPQNQQDSYTVWVDQSYIPDSAFVEIDGEKSETFEMGKGEVRKFLVTVAAARVTDSSPDIDTFIRVSSNSNSYVTDNVEIKVDVTPVTTTNVPSAPMDAWSLVLILGYIIGMVTPR